MLKLKIQHYFRYPEKLKTMQVEVQPNRTACPALAGK
jgi:hypothetical protein